MSSAKTLSGAYQSYAADLCKQFGPRSGPTKRRAWSGSKLLDIEMVFQKEFLEKVDFERKKHI